MKNNKGFTLIELLVSMMIIGLLSTMILVNFSSYKKSSSLVMTTQQIVSEIRKVQNYSLAARSDSNGSTPKGGWGIYFNDSPNVEPECDGSVCRETLYIFADSDGDGRDNDGSEDLEKIAIPSGVVLDKLMFPNAGGNYARSRNCNYFSLIFRSASTTIDIDHPSSPICSNNIDFDKGEGLISLTADGVKHKEIYFNIFGLLDVR